MTEAFLEAVRRRRRNLQYGERGIDVYEGDDGVTYVGAAAVDGYLDRELAKETGRLGWLYDALAWLYVHVRPQRRA